MARIIDAFTQFFDDNGEPLVNGFLKFVESGTNNTDKDTFADVNETIANANPVSLDGAGRCPNVFGTGAYNVISYTNALVQIQQFDPVSAESLLGNFSVWDSATIYDEGDIVIGSDGLYYRSITADNQNQNPISSPGQWEQFKVIGVWNTNITYTTGDSVYGSDGYLYTSRVGSNLGNNPTIDATNWRPGTLNRYTKGADIASANDLPLPDGVSADVTGVVTVNGVAESLAGTLVVYQFDGILILKHNTAASAGFDSLDLPSDADITTVAGDIIVLESQGAGNLYRVVSYTRSDGTPIATGVVTQSDIAANSVGQAELKDATAAQSVSLTTQTAGSISLTGGDYSMVTASGDNTGTDGIEFGNGNAAAGVMGFFNPDAVATQSAYTDSRYFSASPPYNFGPLFVYAIMNNDGTINSLSVGGDPTWAYHGKTNIASQRSDNVSGKNFRTEKTVGGVLLLDLPDNPAELEQYLKGNLVAEETEIEITQDYKDRDKNDKPHPWCENDPSFFIGKTVVLLRPDNSLEQGLYDIMLDSHAKQAFNIIENGYINIRNTNIPASGSPDSLMVVEAKWKNTN